MGPGRLVVPGLAEGDRVERQVQPAVATAIQAHPLAGRGRALTCSIVSGKQPTEGRMRLLFTTQPAYGHFHPLLPLATALQNARHEVSFATSALFGPVVQATGFPAFAAGLNWLESDKSTVPDELKPKPGSTL